MQRLEKSYNARFAEIDVLKGIAIALVVLGHVLAWFYGDFLERAETMSYNEMVLWRYVYSFHMPLFMFVSGFVVFNPLKKYSVKQVFIRSMSYIIPLLSWGVLCSAYREEFNIGNIIGQYWYFKTLVIFLLIVFLVSKLFQRICKCILFTNILISLIFMIIVMSLSFIGKRYGGAVDLIIDSSHLDWNFFYFILGWFLRREQKLYSFCKSEISFALAFLLMIVHVVYPKNGFIAFPLAAIFFFLNISHLLAEGRIKTFCINIGKRTKDIYILHFFFMLKVPDIGIYFGKIATLGAAPSFVIQSFVGLPICLIITYLCYKIGKLLNRNKYISQYCFGNIR